MQWDNRDLFCFDLPTQPRPELGKILVTGATGYVGGRLVPELLARGYSVRVMARTKSPELQERWPGAEIIVADALDRYSLTAALQGIHTAYYLIHSMLLGQEKMESEDLKAAHNFRITAENEKVNRLIYLGGLGDCHSSLSVHLRSRLNVALELTKGKVPTTILRAAIIIGSGSASYEILKHLVENSPILLMPDWGKTKCQPIGIRDVVKYLVGTMETPETAGRSLDIGGEDVLSYEEMLRVLADLLNKKTLFLRVSFATIGFYSYIVSLLTPVPASIVYSLMEGCQSTVVCEEDHINQLIPFKPMSYKEALVRAMSREELDKVYTRWSDAYPPAHELALKLHELKRPPRFSSHTSLMTDKSPAALFKSICRIGGKEGWFRSNILWRLRGNFDRILMGVGTSRGRRSDTELRINDVIDFWRVEDLVKDKLLLLRAEMKLPGRAWLEFRIDPEGDKSRLSAKAHFQTRTVFGRSYWYLFLPFHYFIFHDVIRQIEKKS